MGFPKKKTGRNGYEGIGQRSIRPIKLVEFLQFLYQIKVK